MLPRQRNQQLLDDLSEALSNLPMGVPTSPAQTPRAKPGLAELKATVRNAPTEIEGVATEPTPKIEDLLAESLAQQEADLRAASQHALNQLHAQGDADLDVDTTNAPAAGDEAHPAPTTDSLEHKLELLKRWARALHQTTTQVQAESKALGVDHLFEQVLKAVNEFLSVDLNASLQVRMPYEALYHAITNLPNASGRHITLPDVESFFKAGLQHYNLVAFKTIDNKHLVLRDLDRPVYYCANLDYESGTEASPITFYDEHGQAYELSGRNLVIALDAYLVIARKLGYLPEVDAVDAPAIVDATQAPDATDAQPVTLETADEPAALAADATADEVLKHYFADSLYQGGTGSIGEQDLETIKFKSLNDLIDLSKTLTPNRIIRAHLADVPINYLIVVVHTENGNRTLMLSGNGEMAHLGIHTNGRSVWHQFRRDVQSEHQTFVYIQTLFANLAKEQAVAKPSSAEKSRAEILGMTLDQLFHAGIRARGVGLLGVIPGVAGYEKYQTTAIPVEDQVLVEGLQSFTSTTDAVMKSVLSPSETMVFNHHPVTKQLSFYGLFRVSEHDLRYLKINNLQDPRAEFSLQNFTIFNYETGDVAEAVSYSLVTQILETLVTQVREAGLAKRGNV